MWILEDDGSRTLSAEVPEGTLTAVLRDGALVVTWTGEPLMDFRAWETA